MACEHIRAENVVPGWGCCQCKSYNGYQRDVCRGCNHAHCYDTTGLRGEEAAELKLIGSDPDAVRDWLARPRGVDGKKLMPKNSAFQPEPGDIVFFCAHLAEGTTYHSQVGSHWYGINVRFHGPGGVKGLAKWYNCCNQCYLIVAPEPLNLFKKVPLGGHIVWEQTEPVIGESVS
jgi:hypothetical protein